MKTSIFLSVGTALLLCLFAWSASIADPISVDQDWLDENFSEELPNWTFEDFEEEEVDYSIDEDVELAGQLFIDGGVSVELHGDMNFTGANGSILTPWRRDTPRLTISSIGNDIILTDGGRFSNRESGFLSAKRIFDHWKLRQRKCVRM